MQLIVLTGITLLAFAANSILNRMALANDLIGAGDFALLRVAAGAITLMLLLVVRNRRLPLIQKIQFKSVLGLGAYMVGFSYAYISLDAGLGALILFGTVQVVMFAAAVMAGETLPKARWLGMVLALLGLLVLFWPDTEGAELSVPWRGSSLMLVAAFGWALFSLQGRKITDPLQATAWNFVYVLPLPLVVVMLLPDATPMSSAGVWLALVSGAVTSGLGYALWYRVLPQMEITISALSQLLVPVFALLLGAVLLGEVITMRAVIAAVLIVGGVALGSILSRR
jgi:drug/metabolite transporter (DMT)-like permease